MNIRRVTVIGAPLLAYVASLLHPRDLVFGDDAWLFTGVHLGLAVVICLLGWMVFLLVDGLDGAAATAARVLTLPFVTAYTAYTTFGGVAVGAVVIEANGMPVAEQQRTAALVHAVSEGPISDVLYATASLLWLAVMISVVLALRREAPLPALVLIAVGAAVFARSHVLPSGPVGMGAVLAGVTWVELTRGSRERVRRSVERSV